MSDAANRQELQQGLRGLPDLLRVLSPLQAIADRTSLIGAVADWICSTVGVGCVVHLLEDDDLRLVAETTSSGLPPLPDVGHVLEARRTVIFSEGAGSLLWVALPLSGRGGTFGVLSIALHATADEVRDGALGGLEQVASVLATAITEATAHLRATEISQALQSSLLPSALPLGDWFELSARYVPGTADLRIGGDWYDAQTLPDRTLALSVGDVAGHGIDAAAQMGELRSAMAALRLVRSAPDELISVMHRVATDMGYFATVICARLETSGVLRWSSAGHLPPLVAHVDGSVEALESRISPPLGVGDIHVVPLNSYRLHDGDSVVLFTDGLVERRDEPIDSSLRVLSERVARANRSSPANLIDDLLTHHERSSSTGDDIAVLVCRWRG